MRRESGWSLESSPWRAAEMAAAVGEAGSGSAPAPGVEHVRIDAGDGERDGGPGSERNGSSSLPLGRGRRTGAEGAL